MYIRKTVTHVRLLPRGEVIQRSHWSVLHMLPYTVSSSKACSVRRVPFRRCVRSSSDEMVALASNLHPDASAATLVTSKLSIPSPSPIRSAARPPSPPPPPPLRPATRDSWTLRAASRVAPPPTLLGSQRAASSSRVELQSPAQSSRPLATISPLAQLRGQQRVRLHVQRAPAEPCSGSRTLPGTAAR